MRPDGAALQGDQILVGHVFQGFSVRQVIRRFRIVVIFRNGGLWAILQWRSSMRVHQFGDFEGVVQVMGALCSVGHMQVQWGFVFCRVASVQANFYRYQHIKVVVNRGIYFIFNAEKRRRDRWWCRQVCFLRGAILYGSIGVR